MLEASATSACSVRIPKLGAGHLRNSGDVVLDERKPYYRYRCCARVDSNRSVNWRSVSSHSSKRRSGVTPVFSTPHAGNSCRSTSNSSLESASTMNATARSPTGCPPPRIFPSESSLSPCSPRPPGGGRLERALRYREVCGPAGQDYKLRGVFTSNRELWGAINLWRERGRSDFSACEVAFFDGLPRIWAPV